MLLDESCCTRQTIICNPGNDRVDINNGANVVCAVGLSSRSDRPRFEKGLVKAVLGWGKNNTPVLFHSGSVAVVRLQCNQTTKKLAVCR